MLKPGLSKHRVQPPVERYLSVGTGIRNVGSMLPITRCNNTSVACLAVKKLEYELSTSSSGLEKVVIILFYTKLPTSQSASS